MRTSSAEPAHLRDESHGRRDDEDDDGDDGYLPDDRHLHIERDGRCGYWLSPYDDVIDVLHGTRYVVSIVYDRGEYVIRDYDTAWATRYGTDSIVIHGGGIPVDEAIDEYDLNRVTPIDFAILGDAKLVWELLTVNSLPEWETGWDLRETEIHFHPATMLSRRRR